MANRFLDTNYYKSPFVRSLKGHLKSLYSFIICDCDGAGIWNFDLQAAEMYIGFAVSEKEFFECFVKPKKAVPIGGDKYFFPDFIEHQYPSGLQVNNKAHKNFISILTKYGLIDSNQQIIKKEAPLKEPLEGSHVQYRSSNGQGNGQVIGGLGDDLIFPTQDSEVKLSEMDVGRAIEYLTITKNVAADSKMVFAIWGTFKAKNFNGKKSYKDHRDIIRHFFETLKFEKINGTSTRQQLSGSNQANPGTSEARITKAKNW